MPSRPRAYAPLTIALVALGVLALMTLGLVAGRWQYGRYETRAEALDMAQAAEAIPAAPLATLLSPADAQVDDVEWRLVTFEGELDAASLTALRSRTVERTATLQYLAWVNTAEGAILVNLGWQPRDGAAEPTLPVGQVTLTGVLREQEPDDGKRGEGATRIVAAQMPAPSAAAYPGWVMLREPCAEDGCLATGLKPVPPPQLSLGPHLSYAYQWWLLMVASPIIAVLLVRRDAAHERLAWDEAQTAASSGGAEASAEAEGGRADPAASASSPAAPAPRRRRFGTRRDEPTDEEIEDAL